MKWGITAQCFRWGQKINFEDSIFFETIFFRKALRPNLKILEVYSSFPNKRTGPNKHTGF